MPKLSQAKIRVLDEYESRNDNWRYSEFEQSLEQSMGSKRYGNYQTAKMTILQADKIGSWPKTVKQYVLSNYRVMRNSPSEFHNIMKRLREENPSDFI